MPARLPTRTSGASATLAVVNSRTSNRGYLARASSTMRDCIERVAADWKPVAPSIRGSITRGWRPEGPGSGSAAPENRASAAPSTASSNGSTGTGAGAGWAVAWTADADDAGPAGGTSCRGGATHAPSASSKTSATHRMPRARSGTAAAPQ